MLRFCSISIVIVVVVFAQSTESSITSCGNDRWEISSCGNGCIASCDNPNPEPCTFNRTACREMCVCKPGYVREYGLSGKCVTLEECPPACGENESRNDCANICIHSCKHPNESCSIATEDCRGGCVCRPGYLREFHDHTSKCIPSWHCPKQ